MYREEWWVNARALRKQGMSYKDIGLALGMDWRTAKKLCEQDEPPRPRERERSSKLDPFKPLIDAWLDMRPKLQASLITDRLQGLGYDGSYTIVKDYVRERKQPIANLAVMRFETVPGYQAQADFGKLKVQFLYGWAYVILLIVMLGFSRLRRTTLVPDETRTSLISGLTDTFYAIDGVTYEILLDNLKPVVIRPRSRDEEAILAEEWLRFCAYYGISTNPCWPYRAKDQGQGGEAHRPGEALRLLPHLPGRRAPGSGDLCLGPCLQFSGSFHHRPGSIRPLRAGAATPPSPAPPSPFSTPRWRRARSPGNAGSPSRATASRRRHSMPEPRSRCAPPPPKCISSPARGR